MPVMWPIGQVGSLKELCTDFYAAVTTIILYIVYTNVEIM